MSNISYILNSDTITIIDLCKESEAKFPNNKQNQHDYLWKRMREIGYTREETDIKQSDIRVLKKMSDATLAKYFSNIQKDF
tara:strand:+ start:563 stop:805 length:243 start_codon:yes stop_codon:yes gene_type:complete